MSVKKTTTISLKSLCNFESHLILFFRQPEWTHFWLFCLFFNVLMSSSWTCVYPLNMKWKKKNIFFSWLIHDSILNNELPVGDHAVCELWFWSSQYASGKKSKAISWITWYTVCDALDILADNFSCSWTEWSYLLPHEFSPYVKLCYTAACCLSTIDFLM